MEGKRSSLRNSADKITEVTVTVVTVSLWQKLRAKDEDKHQGPELADEQQADTELQGRHHLSSTDPSKPCSHPAWMQPQAQLPLDLGTQQAVEGREEVWRERHFWLLSDKSLKAAYALD